MMDALDFSVPVTGSGKFIELNAAGSLPKLQPLWSKYCGLRKHLENVEEKLCLCNEPSWLLGFAKKCQRQKKDFEKELRVLADNLEKLKASLKEQCESLDSRLEAIDPSLAHFARTLEGARLAHGRLESIFDRGKSRPDVLKRNWIIQQNPNLRSHELCRLFDSEQLPIQLTRTEKFHEVDCWRAAYRNDFLRKRIHKMISEIRRQ